LGAFLMLAFLISHLYLATTGHKIYSQVMAMITGWEELD
jgi:thiosulfate reductase cytochrome b subunit